MEQTAQSSITQKSEPVQSPLYNETIASSTTQKPKKPILFITVLVLFAVAIVFYIITLNRPEQFVVPISREAMPNNEFGELLTQEKAVEETPSGTRFVDNGDGTVTDNDTGLIWVKDAGEKTTYDTVLENNQLAFAGHNDWRVPNIKELYSLIDFSGINPDPDIKTTDGLKPFINTNYFVFNYGDVSKGDRIIDSQWITSNVYTGSIMNNQKCFFGVNFADGRIKCYPLSSANNNGYFLRYVRGETYGENSFFDNGDGTIYDSATKLYWQKNDSGSALSWGEAGNYCENLVLAGNEDWRLPTAQELQFIVDYYRSPDYTDSAAIDPVFMVTEIENEAGDKDYPFYWTSDLHNSAKGVIEEAVYIAFGRALGFFNNAWIDVHGAGAQRTDPIEGDISEYPIPFGPQGDVRRLHNFVRCVR